MQLHFLSKYRNTLRCFAKSSLSLSLFFTFNLHVIDASISSYQCYQLQAWGKAVAVTGCFAWAENSFSKSPPWEPGSDLYPFSPFHIFIIQLQRVQAGKQNKYSISTLPLFLLQLHAQLNFDILLSNIFECKQVVKCSLHELQHNLKFDWGVHEKLSQPHTPPSTSFPSQFKYSWASS